MEKKKKKNNKKPPSSFSFFISTKILLIAHGNEKISLMFSTLFAIASNNYLIFDLM